jgi:hypothetical protein
MENKTSDNDFLWRQFIKLGEMMGDGLHHEADGKWIAKEYKQLAKILIPGFAQPAKESRKIKCLKVDEQMKLLLEKNKCDCGGTLKQKRSGVKVSYCQTCNQRYVAR